MSDNTSAVKEAGVWFAEGRNGEDVFVFSDDFTHDAGMAVTGDFKDYEQKLAYGREIARRLNLAGAALRVNTESVGLFYSDLMVKIAEAGFKAYREITP